VNNIQEAIDLRNRSIDSTKGTAGPQGIQGIQGEPGPAGEWAINIDGGRADTIYGGIEPIVAGGA